MEQPGDRVRGDVARDLRVLLEPAERVLVPVRPEGDVDAESMTGANEVVAARGTHAEQHLELVLGRAEAALEALVRYLAVELAPDVRVNAVSAGVVETGALEHFPNRDEMLRVGAANPACRLVTPEDVAGAVAFLCSTDAEMVRGHVLVVDGGFSLPV